VFPVIVGDMWLERDLFVEDCIPQVLGIGLWWIGSERRRDELKYHSYVKVTLTPWIAPIGKVLHFIRSVGLIKV
jgi:hypothetical protein